MRYVHGVQEFVYLSQATLTRIVNVLLCKFIVTIHQNYDVTFV